MEFPKQYKKLNKNKFEKNGYSIIPIRFDDRLEIMEWRNEQMFHLRQAETLTIEAQNKYFSEVVAELFIQEKPNQLLFAYLKEDTLIGYGGLVHINWVDKNAEISFLLNPTSNNNNFQKHWTHYLGLIEEVAFNDLKLHKIFTYAFDVRPQLYKVLENVGFHKEAVLKEHCFFNNKFIDVVIHEKRRKNSEVRIRKATIEDNQLIFSWANDEYTRKMSFNQDKITLETHNNWFNVQLSSNTHFLLVFEVKEDTKYVPAGQVKLNEKGVIGVSLDMHFRGKGLGKILINEGITYFKNNTDLKEIIAYIKPNNLGSINIFTKAGFIFNSSVTINEAECFKYICKIN